MLAIYLNDHLALCTGTLELARRVRRTGGAEVYGDGIARVVATLEDDRRALRDLLRRRGLPERRYKQELARAGERLGRLKLNGRLVRGSQLRRLVEHEGLLLGLEGCRQAWLTLRVAGADDGAGASAGSRLEEARRLLEGAEPGLRRASLRE